MNTAVNDLSLDEPSPVWLVSANDLLSGSVVYLAEDNEWTRDISQAFQFDDQAVTTSLLEELEVDQSVVLSPLVVGATRHPDNALTLTHFRNRYRESGPTHL